LCTRRSRNQAKDILTAFAVFYVMQISERTLLLLVLTLASRGQTKRWQRRARTVRNRSRPGHQPGGRGSRGGFLWGWQHDLSCMCARFGKGGGISPKLWVGRAAYGKRQRPGVHPESGVFPRRFGQGGSGALRFRRWRA